MYIDEKDVYALVGERGMSMVHCSQIDALPRADVVPKSEVEYWKQQYFHSCVSNGCVDEKVIEYLRTNAEGHNDPRGEDGAEGEDGQGDLNPLYLMQKADVAREIFEEIKEIGSFGEPIVDYICMSFDELAELKKKYTEGE